MTSTIYKTTKREIGSGRNILVSNSARSAKRISTTGFTLVEILIAISILAIISTITFSAFSRYNQKQAVESSVETVKAALSEARSKTLESLGGVQYGVHFATSSIVVFEGLTFSESDSSNHLRGLPRLIEVLNVSLGGSQEVVFERLTGETSNAGSVTIGVPENTELQKNIIIEQTGLFYVEE